LNTDFLSEIQINKIKEILYKNDGVIAFPTDTVWGVGCVVENEKAVNKIYDMKNRDRSKPLILLGSNLESLLQYTQNIPSKAMELAGKYLPGALTIIVPKSRLAPDFITAGFDSIGIRIPNCPVFSEVLNKAVKTHVLATTSANISGMATGVTKEQVVSELGNEVDYILDEQGFKPIKQESTIVCVFADNTVKILRQGSLIIEDK
jgi:L-threonylcarbamoyladenylate synthase